MSQIFICVSCPLHRPQNKFMYQISFWKSCRLLNNCLKFSRVEVIKIFYIISKFCQRFIQDSYLSLVRILMHPVYGRYFFPEKLFSHNFICRNHKIFYKLFRFPSFPYFYLFNKFVFIKYNLYFRQFKIYTSPTLFCISYYVGKFKHFCEHFMNGAIFFNQFLIT